MKQTYSGGCHCGAVRYEADIDLQKGSLRCNCSICRKGRAWLVAVDGPDFRLLSGKEALSDYQFGTKRIHHHFCKHCGVKSFGRAGGAGGKEFVAVYVNCLENVPESELAALPVSYVDGRNDNFKAPPAETRHL
jgi:hypothetical protein